MLCSPLRPNPGFPPNSPCCAQEPRVQSLLQGTGCNTSLPSPAPWLGACWQLGRGSVGTGTSGPAGARLGRRCTLSWPPHLTKPVPSHKDQGTGQPPPQLLRDVGSDFRGPTAANPHPQTQSLCQATSLPQEKAVAQSWSHRHALAAELRSYFSLPCEIPCTPCPWQHFPPLLSTGSPPEVGLPLPFSCSKASTPAWLWSHQSEK